MRFDCDSRLLDYSQDYQSIPEEEWTKFHAQKVVDLICFVSDGGSTVWEREIDNLDVA